MAVVVTLLVPGAPIYASDAASDPFDRRDVPHREAAFLPIVAFSSDTGAQLGAMGQLARYEPSRRPYAWRLQMQLAASFKDGPGGWELPFHDDYMRLDVPNFPTQDQRFALRVGFQKFVGLGYYGFGNRSEVTIPSPDPAAGRYTSYPASILIVEGILQQRLGIPTVRAVGKLTAARRRTEPYSGSLLAADDARGAITGLGNDSALAAGLGIVLDTRDHETFPKRGMFHDALMSVTPPGLGTFAFSRFTLTARFYWAPAGRYMVFAARALADVLAGSPPFTQEASYGGLNGAYGPGGANAVRGVPVGRFIGKTKAIGNLEVRSLPIHIAISEQYFELGGAAFVDAGRVWSGTFAANHAADGTGIGLHVGLGGGPRIRWGDSFLLRVDAAYAPGADLSGHNGTSGFYITGDAPF